MDKPIQYVQVMSNFDSAYNASPSLVHHSHPVMYMPSSSFSSNSTRSISPSLNSTNLKFSFDSYKPNDYFSDSVDYPSPSSSSVIVHHQPVCSPSPSQAISKLRQINDELCYTLAQSELINHSRPLPSSPSHYHVHHYPVPHETHRSRLSNYRSSSSSSAESEQSETQKHNARITYKAHIPRRRQQQQQQQRQHSASKLDELLISTSDAYLQDDPMTIDIYPTRDQGFVKRIRNRPDNQSPWLRDSPPLRRSSYSEASTYRTPRAPDYDNLPIQPKSRLSDCKERPRSSSVKSRFRPDSAPNPLRQSASSFFSTAPVWRPNGAIKRPKFIGSNAPPSIPKPPREVPWNPAGTGKKIKEVRAFDPTTKSAPRKIHQPVWHPPSKELTKKVPRYFEPTLKPELLVPVRKDIELVESRKLVKDQSKVSRADPKLKTRIANAESKVKSAWESTTTTAQGPRPPLPRPTKPTTTTVPSRVKVNPVPSQPVRLPKKVIPAPVTTTNTGRSSLNDVPTKPLFQSTPRNQSVVQENDGGVGDLFDNESQISEPPTEPVIPRPPPQVEKTPPRTVPEPDERTKSTIKDGVLIHGNDTDNIRDNNQSPIPISNTNKNNNDDEEEEVFDDDDAAAPPTIPSERKGIFTEASPKPDIRDDESINNGGDDDDDDERFEQSAVSPRKDDSPPTTTSAAPADDLANSFFD